MCSVTGKFHLREASLTEIVLSCAGGLSWEDREALAGEVDRHLECRPALDHVLLDLAAVTFVNSAGLGALFQVVQRVRERGARVSLANVSPTLTRMFNAVGLDRLAAVRPVAGPPPPARRAPANAPDANARAAEEPRPS